MRKMFPDPAGRQTCAWLSVIGRRRLRAPCRPMALSLWLAVMVARALADSEPFTPQEPIRLFNGRDLDGFYTWLLDTKREDPRQVFTVTNGIIHISGADWAILRPKGNTRTTAWSLNSNGAKRIGIGATGLAKPAIQAFSCTRLVPTATATTAAARSWRPLNATFFRAQPAICC